MCLVGEVSVGDVSGRGNVCRGSVRRGRVRRGCFRESNLGLGIIIMKSYSHRIDEIAADLLN